MPIGKGDVLYDRVESELTELINPGDETTDIHDQVMEGIATEEAAVETDDTVDTEETSDVENPEEETAEPEEETEETPETEKTSSDETEETEDPDNTDKPSYQDDPNYKAALETKQQLESILEEKGYTDLQEMLDDLKSGTDAQEILGDLDLKTVVEGYKTLEYYKTEWAKREAAEKEENETPEETVERLKRENQELQQKEIDNKETVKQNKIHQQAIKEFDDNVDTILDADENLPDDDKTLIRHLMGINNPALEIAVSDNRAASKQVKSIIQTLKARDAKIAQKAVDDYAKGKGKITVKTKPTSSSASSQSMKKFTIPKNASVEQALAAANTELIEILEQASQSGS